MSDLPLTLLSPTPPRRLAPATKKTALGPKPHRRRLLLILGFLVGLALGRHNPASLQAAPEDVDQDTPRLAQALEAQALLPALGQLDGSQACDWNLSVQNLAAEPVKIVLIGWEAAEASACAPACPGSSVVQISPLLQPGAAWRLGADDDLAGLQAGALFSFSAKSLEAAGIAPGDGQPVADHVLALLEAALSSDCQAYAGFKTAFDGGQDFGGLPLSLAYGGPIAAELQRDCATLAAPGPDGRASASYRGIGGLETGGPDPIQDDFQYAAPWILGARDGHTSILHMQNAGDRCASIEIWFKAQDDCLKASICKIATLAPGQSLSYPAAQCVEPGWQGSAWIRGSQPLGLVIDDSIDRDDGQGALTSAAGIPLNSVRSGEPGSADLTQTGGTTLFAPLIYSEYQGWDTSVQVFNLGQSDAAKAKIYFLDRSGDVITTLVDWICPRGSQTFFLPVVSELSGTWVGSVRIESQDWKTPADAPLPGDVPHLAGSVQMYKYDDFERTTLQEAASYPLLSEARSFDWPEGGEQGGLAGGVGLIALPSLGQADATSEGTRSELAVTNLVKSPGYTDYALILQDANGPVDTLCLRLRERQVSYLELSRLAHLPAGFRGSGLVSAVHWEHAVMDDSGTWRHDAVGLGAVVVQRSRARLGVDRPGDELAISTGAPMTGRDAVALGRILASPACAPPASVDPVPRASSDKVPTVYLPAMAGSDDGASCTLSLSVQSLGTKPTSLMLVAFGEANDCATCAAPLGIVCSGMLSPGGSWNMVPGMLPAGTRSAVVYAIDAVATIPGMEGEINAAAAVCKQASASLAEGCAGWQRLAAAFENGTDFDGLPLGRLQGAAITAELTRRCPGPGENLLDTGYTAPDRQRLGVAGPTGESYRYGLPVLDGPEEGAAEGGSKVHVQNAGITCVTVALHTASVSSCDAKQLCESFDLAPGESRTIDAGACLSPGEPGFGWLSADGPLASVVDGGGRGWASSYAVSPAYVAGSVDGNPLPGGSSRAYAPLTFSEYQGWSQRAHVLNLDESFKAKVKVTWLDRSGDLVGQQVEWICPAGAGSFHLPAVAGLPGSWVGSLRVESMSYRAADGTIVAGRPIQAVADLRQLSDPDDEDTVTQGLRYTLVDASEAMAWPLGSGAGGLESGSGMLALPGLRKALADSPGAASSSFSVANLAEPAGFTDFAILIYDSNGLLDFTCQKLQAQQVEYIDLSTWGYVNGGFTGSALVSATYWEHPQRVEGQLERNVLGLAAVRVEQRFAAEGGMMEGDPLSAVAARALAPEAAAELSADLNFAVRCGSRPIAPTPSPEPSPEPTRTAQTWRIHLPWLLNQIGAGGR